MSPYTQDLDLIQQKTPANIESVGERALLKNYLQKEDCQLNKNTEVGFKGIALKTNQAYVTFTNVPQEKSFHPISETLLIDKGIEVDYCLEKNRTFDLLLKYADVDVLESALIELKARTGAAELLIDLPVARIGLVGSSNPSQMRSRALSLLEKQGVRVKLSAVTDTTVSIIVSESVCSKATRLLHEELIGSPDQNLESFRGVS